MATKEFKGLWIPKEILQDKNLNVFDKFILAEIHALIKDGKCTANNHHIATAVGLSVKTVEKYIPRLEKANYIATKKFRDEKKTIHRIIYLPSSRG